MKAPMPYFGGKSSIADIVWERFGKVDTYLEPFFGSGAVMLANPNWQNCVENVNDLDHFIANVWRAIRAAPEETAGFADHPVTECDLIGRHVWLVNEGRKRIQLCESDPEFYDAKVAGWWLYGIANWIGGGWCSSRGWWTTARIAAANELGTYDKSEILRQRPHLGSQGQGVNRKRPHLGSQGQGVNRKRPHLGSQGQGVNRKRPHLRNEGQGVNRQLPHLRNEGQGVNRQLPHLGNEGQGNEIYPVNHGLIEYLQQLAHRLRKVRVCCGDWQRICVPGVHWAAEDGSEQCVCGIFLDPPYGEAADRCSNIYAKDCEQVSVRVTEWCKSNGENKNMKIAVCGYEGESHHELEALGWSVMAWKSAGGMSSFAKGDKGKENRSKERIWFSPFCIKAQQGQLL